MPSENTAIQRTTRREIEETIAANSAIADITALRAEILTRVPFPVDWQMQNRQARLRPFASFFERILDPDSPSPRMRSLVRDSSAFQAVRVADARRPPDTGGLRFSVQ